MAKVSVPNLALIQKQNPKLGEALAGLQKGVEQAMPTGGNRKAAPPLSLVNPARK